MDRYSYDRKTKSFADSKKNTCINFGLKDLARVEVELNNLDTICNEQDDKIKGLQEVIKMLKGIKSYDIGELLIENIKLKQSQNNKAIEVLKQVKETIIKNISPIIFQDSSWLGKQIVLDEIDNQITELKGEEND